jgi:hypothetical protein
MFRIAFYIPTSVGLRAEPPITPGWCFVNTDMRHWSAAARELAIQANQLSSTAFLPNNAGALRRLADMPIDCSLANEIRKADLLLYVFPVNGNGTPVVNGERGIAVTNIENLREAFKRISLEDTYRAQAEAFRTTAMSWASEISEAVRDLTDAQINTYLEGQSDIAAAPLLRDFFERVANAK